MLHLLIWLIILVVLVGVLFWALSALFGRNR